MKPSKVLRMAARRNVEEEFFLWVDFVGEELIGRYMADLYADMEILRERKLRGWTKDEQSLALCLAAAIAESEGE